MGTFWTAWARNAKEEWVELRITAKELKEQKLYRPNELPMSYLAKQTSFSKEYNK